MLNLIALVCAHTYIHTCYNICWKLDSDKIDRHNYVGIERKWGNIPGVILSEAELWAANFL